MMYYICEMVPADRQITEWLDADGDVALRLLSGDEDTAPISMLNVFESETFEKAKPFVARVIHTTVDRDAALAFVEKSFKEAQ